MLPRHFICWIAVLALAGCLGSPHRGSGEVSVVSAGVSGDGVTVNTVGLQRAINSLSAAGGGTLVFPAGRYLTGTVEVKSGVVLRLEEGAVLLGSTDPGAYRNLDPFVDGSGNRLGEALIVGRDAERVGIEGKGTIDGQSPKLKAAQGGRYAVRPFLVRWVRCRDVVVRDVRLQNPGAWTLNFFETRGAVVEGVTIRSRDLGMPNNDGINIDSSEDVRVRGCDVVSGDDALVIKSTGARVCRDISAVGCKLSSRTNAIKLGTESYGGFEKISVSGCEVTDTRMSGIALYAVDGGDLRDVTIEDVKMSGVTLPISIRLGERLKAFREGQVPRAAAGHLCDVRIRNVSARGVGSVGVLINGVPGHPVERVVLENVEMEVPGGGSAEAGRVVLPEKEKAYPEFNMFGKVIPAYGMYVRHARGVELKNVRVTAEKPDGRAERVLLDVEGVREGK